MVELQYFGNSFFTIKDNKALVVIDPIFGFSDKQMKKKVVAAKMSDMKGAAVILLTNELPEHFDKDLVERIALEENATVLAHDSILKQLSLPRSQKIPIQANSEFCIKGFKIKTTTAHFPKSFYPLGYIVECSGKRVYHAGVTALLDTFSSIKVDVALLPISDRSMDIIDAVRATKLMKPKTVIPMQYDIYDSGKNDPKELKRRIEESVLATETVILSPGKKMKF